MLAILVRSSGLCGRSGVQKFEVLGYFENVLISQAGARSTAWGAHLGPMLTVSGCFWSLCWRSWAVLGAYVGDLEPLFGSMLAALGRLGAYVGGLGGDHCEK